jgi:predicted DNA-binding protein with PD1-like motif
VDYSGPLDIVSAQGSVALKGNELVLHVHIQLSSREGCYGGHLAGATVFSTAEVAIGELDYQLQRYADDYTGLNELIS